MIKYQEILPEIFNNQIKSAAWFQYLATEGYLFPRGFIICHFRAFKVYFTKKIFLQRKQLSKEVYQAFFS